jgi:hypothetical protein
MSGQIIASPVDAKVHGFIKEQAQRESCTVFYILNEADSYRYCTGWRGKRDNKGGPEKEKILHCASVFRIRDIFIRIRILRSVLFFGSTAFMPFKMPTKMSLFSKFFAHFFM